MFGKEPDWIWPDDGVSEGYPSVPGVGLKNDMHDHGTCMFSKIFGEPHGISKRAAVTIVRLPQAIRGPGDGEVIPDHRARNTLGSYNKILEDVAARGPTAKYRSVINFSLGSGPNAVTAMWPVPPSSAIGLYHRVVEALIEAGVVFVTTSGNNVVSCITLDRFIQRLIVL